MFDSARYFRSVSSLTALLLLTPILGIAQNATSGSVTGQVTDQQGAFIPNAEVRLTNVGTNTPRTTQTNSDGRYTFNNVEPGNYDLQVTKQGFAQTRLQRQTVEVASVLTLNVTMQVGATTTTVEVQAQAGAELQTTNATVGTTISGVSLDMLPNLGRDANAFMTLQPGVTPTGEVGGMANDNTMFQLDGGNNTNDMDGNMNTYKPASGYIGASSTGGTPSGVIPTPAESIEEFKVATSNQTADFNQAGGAQVQMVTKRGTDTFHGSAYEYYLASNFGANYWLNNHTPSGNLPYTPLPKSHQNRFGGALGGTLLPNIAGGKWYFFVNYEGRRFPQSTTTERLVPTASLRAGIITLPNGSGNNVSYNVNPYPVSVNGVTYAPCGGANYCDPRGIGMNSVVSTIWNKYMPLPNDPSAGDGINTQGYVSSISLPQTSDFGVVRIDHDFGAKWHLMSSYRYYNFSQFVTTQTDIGGILCGSVGQACAAAFRPQKPWYLVIGLTTTITPSTTNDLHVSYLRNFWQWYTGSAPPQLAGLGAAVEIGGEFLGTSNPVGASRNALIPYNVNTQDVRQRFWDGKDKSLRDDVNSLHGNHLIQFGGAYQRNFDYHLRNDNGAGIDVSPIYQIANDQSALSTAAYTPTGVNSSRWGQYYDEVLGLVSQAQVMYSRAGNNLALQPLGTPLYDQDIVPTYDFYISDTWHARKDFTLTYGVSYTVQMPPYEVNGKQVELVDSSGKIVSLSGYLTDLNVSAMSGVSYDPLLGSETIRNVPAKYPFQPFYGGLSPRVSAAWNPSFTGGLLGKLLGNNQTVIRGGYSRIYGRLNGVGLVLIPLLGTGLAQTDICAGPLMGGGCSSATAATPANGFRIGTDGNSVTLPAVSQTLPHPYYGGIDGPATGVSTYIDPSLKPDHSDEFNFSIQRAISQKVLIEAGYIGRKISDEFQQINIDAVPINYTLGGQTFANAFASTYLAVAAGNTPASQPWFNAALGGPNSAYCVGYANCTAAVAAKNTGLITTPQVYTLWHALAASPNWTLGNTMPSTGLNPQVNGATFINSSLGWGNYNALYFSATFRNWHGLTARSNFTWGRALGTQDEIQATSEFTALNPFDLHAMYGPQPFDVRFSYNLSMVYQTPWFKNQTGVIGRILGGWSIAPLFTAQSGYPIDVNVDGGCDCESFGELNPNGGATLENAIPLSPYTAGNSAHYNVAGSGGVASSGDPANGGSGINLFANPAATFAQFRPLVLGLDTSDNGAGPIRGFPSWDLDLAVTKEFRIAERFSLTFSAQITNVLNHMQPDNPYLDITDPAAWGVVTSQAIGASPDGTVPAVLPRQIEFGLRLHF